MNSSDLKLDITAAADGSYGSLEETERVGLLAACEKLKKTLESPLEVTSRVVFGAHQAIALRLAIDMKLFDAVAAITKDGGPAQTPQLATVTGADPLLLGRITRLLAGMGILQETKHETFVSTPLAGAYVTGSPLTDAVIHVTSHINILAKMPDYLEQNGYKNPDNAFDGPFQFAMQTKLHYFEWLKSSPRDQHAFNTVMSISRMNRGEEWFKFYPIEEKLQVLSDQHPALVDIGGGLGHDLITLQRNFPNLRGRLVLQDLAIVINEIKDLPFGIEAMAYDFFTPQPVQRAKAYYLRTVLHDWPDKQARVILGNIRAAMSKDSILLVNENAIPESNVPLYSAQLDLSMMACFSSLDRTQTQFKELLHSSGFELIQVWSPAVIVPGSGTLFEAKLRE